MQNLPTIFNPQQREKEKSELQRAQDIAYTVNHAVVCTVADVFGTPINAFLQKKLNDPKLRLPIGCNDSSHDHGKTGKRGFWSFFAHVAPAEIAADVIAVPITVGVQRVFPGFMSGLSKVMEPLFGDIFRFGANVGGKSWAKKHGLDPNGAEAKEKAKEIYHHESSHLGQAAVWTAAAFGLNVGIQYSSERIKPPEGGAQPLKNLIAAKGIGSTITSAALVSFRGFFPVLAEKSDDFFSHKVFIPLSRKFSGLFGISKDTLKDLEKQEAAEDRYWEDKVAQAKLAKTYEAGRPVTKPPVNDTPKPEISSVTSHETHAPILAKQA